MLFSFLPTLGLSAEPASPDHTFFETRIRPLLAEHCYSCHSAKAEKLKGGLHADSREGLLQGGDSGPAVVPGDPAKSRLIQAVSGTNADLQMPPKGRKLSAREVADLARWVREGASWPETDPAAVRPSRAPRELTEQDRAWWAFQPVRRPEPPAPRGGARATSPIDAFIGAGLEARGLKPNPPAARRELIRRAYFDLLGLPPSPEEIAAFERDPSPGAWARLIDELLARPQYGERWGRHWLDVVRFAQSNGYERDGEKPEAWRYRDYVIRAFNEDKPYDQFIREQIAGDELDQVTRDSITATGFQRLGVWDDEPDDKRMAEFDELDDILSTTGTAFLGLTIGCARCHEHKFDPIPQADYYRLLAFFRNVRLNEGPKFTLEAANYVPLATPTELRSWQAAQEARWKPLQARLAGVTNAAERKALTRQIDEVKGEKPPFEWALAVRERGRTPPPTHVLIRGHAGQPGPEVQAGFPAVLGGPSPVLPAPAPDGTSIGRRRALAGWLASPDNPLTARVMVNRIWQHHFGRGLVKTTSDFGRAGARPTHPELLDWLAAEFVAGGWSIKRLHRLILLSDTYQRSSRAGNARAVALDPDNDSYWRQNLRRLDAEALRDTLLALSGRLNPKMGGRGFFPRLSGEVLAGQSRPGLDWERSSPEELSRRSVYAYVRRTMPVPMLDAFDYSNTTSPLSERAVTTVAPQALMLLNDAFIREQAAAMADRLERETAPATGSGGVDPLITRGFQLAVGREPTRAERRIARDFLARQEHAFAALRTRITFRPDVPSSLSVSYMDKLSPADFLTGPASGWDHYRGRWSGAYEGIRTVERERGPFALAVGPAFSNGLVKAGVVLHTACESAGLYFRASARNHEVRGYELALAPREQRVALLRHDGGVVPLTEAPADLPTARGLAVKIVATDARIRVWLGGRNEPVLDVTDPKPALLSGQVGVRAWGAAVSLDDLSVQPDGQAPVSLGEARSVPAARRAREAFCLMLLNLNEVVYVD